MKKIIFLYIMKTSKDTKTQKNTHDFIALVVRSFQWSIRHYRLQIKQQQKSLIFDSLKFEHVYGDSSPYFDSWPIYMLNTLFVLRNSVFSLTCCYTTFFFFCFSQNQ